MRVRVRTVSKERRGTLQVKVRARTVHKGGVRAGIVCKTVLRVLQVYKRAL